LAVQIVDSVERFHRAKNGRSRSLGTSEKAGQNR
jgi:hypothetical protein